MVLTRQADNVLSEADAKAGRAKYQSQLTEALEQAQDFKPTSEMLGGKWKDIVWPATSAADPDPETGLPTDRLAEVGRASVSLPDSFVRVIMASH